jgi:type I restriction enzyme R subunit
MPHGPEHAFSVTPAIDALVGMGYDFVPQDQNEADRDGLNQVVLKSLFLKQVRKLNNTTLDVARAVYNDLLRIQDNEQWTRMLRGDYSRSVPGQSEKKTIKLIEFLHPENNDFTVTEELTVVADKTRRADLVVYVNGIPLVVIECKSPLSQKDKTGEAFDQIKQYEAEIPRLFYSNAFSMVTNGVQVLYGPTGAASHHWSTWKDPWPRTDAEFDNDFAKGLWCLLAPERLLDILAHFIVFERDPNTGKAVKKMCRYQQYRAVNKIVERVVEGTQKRGLVWHTQGSGKSLTMVFAALKLKTHRTIDHSADHPALANPNLLVLTDRIQLDDQLSRTFEACGVRNPKQIKRSDRLLQELHSNKQGLTLLSMIFKFQGSVRPVANSEDWILLVDECHRTQEKDLGAYLRKTLPNARFFGFTGTPVKKNDHDTYRNFGESGEGYLDRYSIDDAVADGATVPIRYTGRMTKWHLEGAEIDILFDQKFSDLQEEEIEQIKKSGATFSRLAKHTERVALIAYDMWTHYREHALPDGFKAQVACLDREATVLYKEALDRVLAKHFEKKEGLAPGEAKARAEAFSACVYTSNQEDGKPSEDPYVERVRGLLRKHALKDDDEKDVVEAFTKPGQPPYLILVCDKLLTGFDAPIESVMYLDKPLREHNLLQAIARTNRVAGPLKQYGLIVDYIGVTKNLDEALATYREADVENAMRDLEELTAALKEAHAEVVPYLKRVRIKDGRSWQDRWKDEYDNLVQELGSEDQWLTFERKSKAFIRAYEAVSPDPVVLEYRQDMKWVAGFLPYGTLKFGMKEGGSLTDYSAKIREMLDEHLHVTGIKTVVKLRRLTDPEFWTDFKTKGKDAKDLKTAAVRKTAELKKELSDRTAENEARYESFSERLREIIKKFQEGLLTAAQHIEELRKIAQDLKAEDDAHKDTGLTREGFGVLRILEAHKPASDGPDGEKLEAMSEEIDALYRDDQTAPPGWHEKSQLRKGLRQQVRRKVFDLGLEDWKGIPSQVDEYAAKHYVKL